MKLFTNGCSFTWGGGILEEEFGLTGTLSGQIDEQHRKFRECSVWPYKLHQLLKSDNLVNLSIGCGSNSRIVRSTIDYFIALQSQNHDISDHIAVIQWTEPSRFEIYHADAASWLLIKTDVVIPEVDHKHYRDFQMRLLDDQRNHLNSLFNSMMCLSHFFDKWNIKYLFTGLLQLETNTDYQYNYCVENMNWFMGHPSFTICSSIPEEEFRYSSGHPNIAGHERIANSIYMYMKNTGCI